jgi:quinol monooxygenase YgiN
MMWTLNARRDAGVLRAELYEDVESPSAYLAVTEWGSREVFEAHVRGSHVGAVLGALAVLARQTRFELSDTTPESDALALIHRLRSPEIERGSPDAREP